MDYDNMTIEEIEELLIHSKNCVNNSKNSNYRKGKKQAMLKYKEISKVYKERIRNAKKKNLK